MFENHRCQGYVNAQLDSDLAAFQDLHDSGERFSAIICESDQMAAGVYKACRRTGLSISEDLSVVDFNNSAIAAMLEQPLSSVDQQIQREALTDRVKKIAPKLELRNSVRNLYSGSGKDIL